jgi:transposase
MYHPASMSCAPPEQLDAVGEFGVCVCDIGLRDLDRVLETFVVWGVVVSVRVQEPGEVPAETVRVARAAFPKGCLAIRMRDELGVVFRDEDFAGLFAVRGRPAWSPGRLALVLVLQFVENLSDWQAALAVRSRIDWKYALGLELGDPGFDHSVLSEFRDRLLSARAGRELFDAVLQAAVERGLVRGGGRMRTDSTHVLSRARELDWLELVGESLRAALNAVAAAEPQWLARLAPPAWFEHYATRLDEYRLPKSRAKRAQVGERIGADTRTLLDALERADAPARLRALPAVGVLGRVWSERFGLVDGQVRILGQRERAPGAQRVVTPYDPQARGAVKRDLVWDGYKAHLTETCEPGTPHLITHVETTVATVPDDRMAAVVHTALAERGLLPVEHWVDAGYANAAALSAARRDHAVALHGPLQRATTAQARSQDGYGQDAFSIDWDRRQAVCPQGRTSVGWRADRSQHGLPVVRVSFSTRDCRPCPAQRQCVTAKLGRRVITLRAREDHQVLQQARALQQTDEWKQRYKIRAGIEGTISQAVGAFGMRRSRYWGLAKTGLQHQLTGAAINLARIDAWLTHTPHARTRTTPLAALRPAD